MSRKGVHKSGVAGVCSGCGKPLVNMTLFDYRHNKPTCPSCAKKGQAEDGTCSAKCVRGTSAGPG